MAQWRRHISFFICRYVLANGGVCWRRVRELRAWPARGFFFVSVISTQQNMGRREGGDAPPGVGAVKGQTKAATEKTVPEGRNRQAFWCG